eukprot:COSAG06_NODE_5652_length_3341_cov_2.227637_5_plen_112_part_01
MERRTERWTRRFMARAAPCVRTECFSEPQETRQPQPIESEQLAQAQAPPAKRPPLGVELPWQACQQLPHGNQRETHEYLRWDAHRGKCSWQKRRLLGARAAPSSSARAFRNH